jgi:hypothetical protein
MRSRCQSQKALSARTKEAGANATPWLQREVRRRVMAAALGLDSMVLKVIFAKTPTDTAGANLNARSVN